MLCVDVSTGSVQVVNPQPADVTTCQYVLVAPGEVGLSWLPPLTSQQGADIGLAVVSVLVLAWAFSIIARVIRDH